MVDEVKANEKTLKVKMNMSERNVIVFVNRFFRFVFYVEQGGNILCEIAFIFFGFIV